MGLGLYSFAQLKKEGISSLKNNSLFLFLDTHRMLKFL